LAFHHKESAKMRYLWILLFALTSAHAADSDYIAASKGKNGFMAMGQLLVSQDKKSTLFLQSDGNLVLYKSSCIGDSKCEIWNTGVHGEGSYFAAIQEDGNLVVYRGTPSMNLGHAWDSKTPGAFGDYFVAVQNDENVVIYKGTGPGDNRGAVWSSKHGIVTETAKKARCVCVLNTGSHDLRGGACGSIECQRTCYDVWSFSYKHAWCQGGNKQCAVGCVDGQ
jgi:hypothetical protein